jgi:hypothetical protein
MRIFFPASAVEELACVPADAEVLPALLLPGLLLLEELHAPRERASSNIAETDAMNGQRLLRLPVSGKGVVTICVLQKGDR